MQRKLAVLNSDSITLNTDLYI